MRRSSSRLTLAMATALVAVVTPPAFAQYSFDPNNADEQTPGIKYFGSAKDDRGALLTGVTVLVEHEFEMVTDDTGRYRGNIPFGLSSTENMIVGCSKPGYTETRMVKIPGPQNAVKQTVEVDCVLRKDPASK